MNTPITIDQLNNTYCDRIVKLILPIQQIEFNVPVTLEGQPDLLDIETSYQKEGGNFWGAFYNAELVGTIALINIGHQACALRKMFVKKEFRGKEHGIAQLLLEKYIRFCRENAITDIYLGTVDVLKAAHRFYEKNGFMEINMNELPEYFPRMPADNIFYHLHITNAV
ncbi:GNAT family N-acetyltransferase [Pedobacter nyackensis]|uniref:GNAT family N-acetyltransferase n=1 Tax=Pedobacter nyackensis TaxID=475255 RepID=UPI00293119A7|nr:GNAT family N-acetyltransferase [Pedobacter nyackensis]